MSPTIGLTMMGPVKTSSGFGFKSVVGMFAAVRVTRVLFSRVKFMPLTSACSIFPVEKWAMKSVWLSQILSSVIHERISRLIAVELTLAKRGGVAIESRDELAKRNWLRSDNPSLKSFSNRSEERRVGKESC